jgi:hypothetical protein
MSEPLSSHEIEDVLSSIRRLVSEDLRPAPGRLPGGDPAPAAAAAPPSGGKLLLTPSLRVVADPDPVADAGSAPVGAAAPVDPLVLRPAAAAGTPEIAPHPAPKAAAEAGFSGDGGEEDMLWAAPGVLDARPDAAGLDVAGLEDDPEPVDEPAAPRGHWSAETVPVPEMDWMQAEADWTEDEGDDPLPFVAHPRPGLTQDPLARAWADRAEADVRAGLQETVTVPPAAPPKRGDAGGQAAGGVGGGNGSGAGGSGAGGGGTGGGGTGGGGTGGGGTGGPGLFDPEDPMIDEETLRDIVRDIIREELAGTLGERITRNVRKLVRVEINRALTAREFE